MTPLTPPDAPPRPSPAPAAADPPPPLPAASSPPSAIAIPPHRLPSIVPIVSVPPSGGGGGASLGALSVPPGVTISHEPPPPGLVLQLAAVLPDVAAIGAFLTLAILHEWTPVAAAGWIAMILAARAKPRQLGAQAVSGVATLVLSAAGVKDAPPPSHDGKEG